MKCINYWREMFDSVSWFKPHIETSQYTFFDMLETNLSDNA